LDVLDAIEDGLRRTGLGEAEIFGEVGLKTELTRFASCKVERVKELPIALPATAFGELLPIATAERRICAVRPNRSLGGKAAVSR
jgi:hypothetical protein